MLDPMQTLGNIVRNTRINQNLTQNDVASRINVDTRTILNIENCKGNPKMAILFPLIRELQIDPTSIFYPELEQHSDAATRLKLLLAQCSNDELCSLFPIIEAILTVLRSNDPTTLGEE